MNSERTLWYGAPAVLWFGSFALGIVLTVAWEPSAWMYMLFVGVLLASPFLHRWGLWPRQMKRSLLLLLLLGALLTTGHVQLHNKWLKLMPEGEGGWAGHLVAYEAPDGTLQWRLSPDFWRGPGRPLLNLEESAYGDFVSDVLWDDLSMGLHVSVTGTLRHPRPSGNPGEFDGRGHMFRQSVVGVIYVESIVPTRGHSTPIGLRLRSTFFSWLRASRLWIAEVLEANSTPSAWPILRGLLTGSRSALDDEVEEAFRRAGISHLLAVSGVHVGMMATLALLCSRVLRLRRWQSTVFVTACIWAFVFLAGARPSALRAGITSTLGYTAYTVRRAVDPLQFWALAGLGLLGMKPLLLYDVGFQLSFAASGSILLWIRMLPGTSKSVRARWRGILLVCGVSLAAQLGTVVPIAYHFNELSLVGIAINWIAVPLASPVLFLGAIGALSHTVIPHLGAVLIRLAGSIVDSVLPGLIWVGSQPWAAIEVAAPMPATIVGWALLVVGAPFAVLHPNVRTRRIGMRLCLGAILLFVFAVWHPIVEAYQGIVHVTFVDVGQGDAILIRTARGRNILVDGGGQPRRAGDDVFFDIGERQLVPLLKHLGVRKIDLLVNTHPDEDHLQGLLAVLRQRHVDMVVDSGRETESMTYHLYKQLLSTLDVDYVAPKRGDKIEIEPGVVLYILNPPFGNYGGSLNNDSVVIRIETPHGSLLLTGDLERSGQQDLLWGDENVDVTADVIKVPHHGSGRDLDLRFIDAVAPSIAVIQVGRNAYGHPASATVAAYIERGAKVLRNDIHGAITLSFAPRGIRIRTHR